MADILRECEAMAQTSDAKNNCNHTHPGLHAWALLSVCLFVCLFLFSNTVTEADPTEGQPQREKGKLSRPLLFSTDTHWAPKCWGLANDTESLTHQFIPSSI